jgi:all-trans-retinol 13,14-reductase
MNNKYEIIIVGSGVGGLVCGCYLAKYGRKVLIVEQNKKVGGYCSSFTRDDYSFDIGIHYCGGIKRGFLGRILKELNLQELLAFNQIDPTDIVLLPDTKVFFRKNPLDTLDQLKKNFPKEKTNIDRFFSLLLQKDLTSLYSKFKNFSFNEIINDFFVDASLKKIFNELSRGVIGAYPRYLPAWIGFMVWREFFLDPGYYHLGGMGKLTEALSKKFAEYGGVIQCSSKVNKIYTRKNQIKSIFVNNSQLIYSRKVVANIDPFQLAILLNKPVKSFIREKVISPSLSAVVIYLGLKRNFSNGCGISSCLWDLTDDFRKKEHYGGVSRVEKIVHSNFLVSSPSFNNNTSKLLKSKNTIQIFSLAPYVSKKFWVSSKDAILNGFINRARNIVNFKDEDIELKEIATPLTFNYFTNNYKGAIFGRRLFSNLRENKNYISSEVVDGLFFTGAWYSYGGVSETAISGRRTAQCIVNEKDIFLKNLT